MTPPDGPAVPTLALVLRRVADLFGSTVEDIIAGRGARIDDARDLFCWLATEATAAGAADIGYAIAIGAEAVEHAWDAVALRRQADMAFRTWAWSAVVEVRAEADLVRRRLLAGAPDRDAAATARRVLGGDRQAVSVAVLDLVHLAASYELLVQRVEHLQHATAAVAAVAFTPGERAARDQREHAERALFTCVTPQSTARKVA